MDGERDPDLGELDPVLAEYISDMSTINPEDMSRDEALAYWINLYNAGALRLAARAQSEGRESVLRIPGAFSRPLTAVNGETLSLDAVEHGKIRRFKDPRIHAALVCGSVSCPTLRTEPYRGTDIDRQLDSQMEDFLTAGGAVFDSAGVLKLSRVFLWYGSDFVRPTRMPSMLPVSKSRLVPALGRWLSPQMLTAESVEFQPYDWGLRCSLS